jgi:hypothetical protein
MFPSKSRVGGIGTRATTTRFSANSFQGPCLDRKSLTSQLCGSSFLLHQKNTKLVIHFLTRKNHLAKSGHPNCMVQNNDLRVLPTFFLVISSTGDWQRNGRDENQERQQHLTVLV